MCLCQCISIQYFGNKILFDFVATENFTSFPFILFIKWLSRSLRPSSRKTDGENFSAKKYCLAAEEKECTMISSLAGRLAG
jgi:hypothetical protein